MPDSDSEIDDELEKSLIDENFIGVSSNPADRTDSNHPDSHFKYLNL